jgi:flagellar basal-body rod modification protein FlgD
VTTPIDVSYITNGTGKTTTTKTANNELDKQAFLELFVAQLKYQDPSSPMDTSQMMAQTTQLATMESLEEIASTSREAFALQMRLTASDLVGKQVSWTDADGKTQSGTVSGVSYANSVPLVMVGKEVISLDNVSLVTTPGGPTTLPTTDTDDSGTDAGSDTSGTGTTA